MVEQFVAFDLETTGLFAETDRIVEVGAVRFDADGRESGRFERLVHPGRPMSPTSSIQGLNSSSSASTSRRSLASWSRRSNRMGPEGSMKRAR